MRIIAIAAIVRALAGCKATADRTVSEYAKVNRVDLVRFGHEVVYPNGSRDPSTAEAERLDSFLRDIQVTSNDMVLLDGGSPVRRAALGARLAYRNLKVRQTGNNGAAGRVKVIVERYVVTPPTCSDWSKPVGQDSENTPRSGFGCANTANLGMMVANPRDLIRGQTPGAAGGEAVSGAIRRYRAGKITKLQDDNSLDSFSGGSR